MPKRTSDYNSWQLAKLTNPETAAAYLSAAISDSPEMFRKALRNVAQSRQMAKVARDAGVTRESLYRATSDVGNPTLDTLDSVLQVLELKLAVVPKAAENAETPSLSVTTNIGIAIAMDIAALPDSPEFAGLKFGSNVATASAAGATACYLDTMAGSYGSFQYYGSGAIQSGQPLRAAQNAQGGSGAIGPILKFLAENAKAESGQMCEI